jgi:hypothetical protein
MTGAGDGALGPNLGGTRPDSNDAKLNSATRNPVADHSGMAACSANAIIPSASL